MKRHSFRIISLGSPKTKWKLYLSTKVSHQEIKFNYGISAMTREILPRDKINLSLEKPLELVSRSTRDENSVGDEFTPALKTGWNYG